MNLDDPKLTAYALGELPAQERALVQRHIASEAKMALEVRETEEMAEILRQNLALEPMAELGAHRRDAIFRAAGLAGKMVPRANEEPAAMPVQPRSHILTAPSWWNRPGPWQAIAACAIVGFSVYVLSVPRGVPNAPQLLAGATELVMPVTGNSVESAVAHVPEILSPKDTTPGVQPPRADYAAAAQSKIPKPELPSSIPPVDIPSPDSRGPRVVGPLASNQAFLAGADRGKAANRPPVVDEQVVVNYLRARMKDAERVKPGATYSDLRQVFEPVPGADGRYQMIRNPAIKLDVQLDPPPAPGVPPAPEVRIKAVSKPYLE
jgi:hypothetical protein